MRHNKMLVIKGFVEIASLIKNEPNALSLIGELSTHSKTYALDIQTWSSTAHPELDLSLFHCERDNELVAAPQEVVDQLLQLCQWLRDESIGGGFNGNETSFQNKLLDNMDTLIEDVQVGDMVSNTVGNTWLPSFIIFKLRGIGEDNFIRLWFADEAFQQQYDEFHVKVVHPLATIDLVFSDAETLRTKLLEETPGERRFREETVRDNKPYTFSDVISFDWSNPIDPDNKVTLSWVVLIYGIAGRNIDVVRNAIIDSVLTDSTRGREDWSNFVPDLFKRTEFIIIPYWDNYAIPNQVAETGIFSPTVRPKDIVPITKVFAPEYLDGHIAEYVTTSVLYHRSISIMVIGGPDNRDMIYRLDEKFPDLFVISSINVEIGRMSRRTRDFLMMLESLVILAETVTEYSNIPLNVTRLTRNGVTYLVRSFENVQYMVVTASSYAALKP